MPRNENKKNLLKPQQPIIFLNSKDISEISPNSIKIEQVGKKAYGLSCLPKFWTLPFFVISDELFHLYTSAPETNRKRLLKQWIEKIVIAALKIGIKNHEPIIVRSSGCFEGLIERGQFYSENGTLDDIYQTIYECLQKLLSDKNINKQKIPLVIQKLAIPISEKGHLSNERRCYEESRDWLGEFEEIEKIKKRTAFKINLRHWRKKILISNQTKKSLRCNLSVRISEILKIPATWAYDQRLRLHFEWVWDGKVIYLVQADQEIETKGVDPTRIHQHSINIAKDFVPTCLKLINKKNTDRYDKIRNVGTYIKLNLPIIKLYILDDQSVINNLASGKVPKTLKNDLVELVKGSLVIRTDIATNYRYEAQLLPRTNEVRDLNSALAWLKKISKELKKQGTKDDVAFIFHNFVPSLSSAFAFAAPNERKVQIEALWGLPEGIYYNSHDKYIIDTKNPQGDELHQDDTIGFSIHEKRHYKKFFFSPDEDGHWTIKKIMPPYDWRSSIPRKKWIKDIAFESRRIAEEEGKPLSIMWFIGISNEICHRPVLPWYHEQYDLRIKSRAPMHRTKTPFDKSLIVRTRKDIEELKHESEKPSSSIRRIRIQPFEEALIRDKDILRNIGELAHKIDAIILLEGGILSHAYYQLMQTNAIVEVLHPFDDSEDKQEFNKLVRDKVSLTIKSRGEVVSETRLSGEFLLRALREKIVEEAIEVMDASDQDSIVSELADVCEIIDEIISQLNVNRDELKRRQEQKREKTGGFKNGAILLETKNPLPTEKGSKVDGGLFEDFHRSSREILSIDARKIIEASRIIEKWSDRREHPAATEVILHLNIPLVRDDWTAYTPEKIVDAKSDNIVKAKLVGTRKGSKLHIELSIFSPHRNRNQLELFESEE